MTYCIAPSLAYMVNTIRHSLLSNPYAQYKIDDINQQGIWKPDNTMHVEESWCQVGNDAKNVSSSLDLFALSFRKGYFGKGIKKQHS